MKKLKAGKRYLIKYSGEFCHCVGRGGYSPFSKHGNHEDTMEVIFVGSIRPDKEETFRNIFLSNDWDRRYIMMGDDFKTYVVKRL